METFFNRFVFCLLLHLFAMEKVAPVPLFRPSCGRIFYKNSKVWPNFKNISCFRMLTATPGKLSVKSGTGVTFSSKIIIKEWRWSLRECSLRLRGGGGG